jgi:hypothetical protein
MVPTGHCVGHTARSAGDEGQLHAGAQHAQHAQHAQSVGAIRPAAPISGGEVARVELTRSDVQGATEPIVE